MNVRCFLVGCFSYTNFFSMRPPLKRHCGTVLEEAFFLILVQADIPLSWDSYDFFSCRQEIPNIYPQAKVRPLSKLKLLHQVMPYHTGKAHWEGRGNAEAVKIKVQCKQQTDGFAALFSAQTITSAPFSCL